MQIRSTISPLEIREAARLSRPRYFWLRFFAANWYATVICFLVIWAGMNALIHHEHLRWAYLTTMLAIGGFLMGFSWYRWNVSLSKTVEAVSARSGTLSLDSDGVRTTLITGALVFVPWSSYSKWVEGKSIFLLTGSDGATIVPIDDGMRDIVRGLLTSKVS